MVATVDKSLAFPTYTVETEEGRREFRRALTDVDRESGRCYYDRVHKDGPKIVKIEETEMGEPWEVVDLEGDFVWQRAPVWIYERVMRREWIPLEEV